MPPRVLITSALPYINGIKHLGNLVGSMLPADVFARYLRARGRDVLYICATDEHGTPAELAALEAGLPVAEYCRQQHDIQRSLGEAFGLSFDHFGRTSSPQNHELTQYFARKLAEHGLLYEKVISQVYSIDDQRFLPDRYIVGTCPYCGSLSARGDQCENCTRVLDPTQLVGARSAVSGSTNLEVRETKHLFLRLSALVDELRQWINTHPQWPPLARSIANKWLDEGLHDRGITRDLSWGVPVDWPGFERKVFYVWFDAPIGYIAATKEWADLDARRSWRSWWFDVENVEYVEFMAKDNVPFHTVMFPATLIGSREPWKRVDFVKAFNWLTYYGGKFSTSSRRGIFMNDALALLPPDYWRYYLMASAPESDDVAFTWETFAATVNKDLADVFGNFVNRVIRFAHTRFGDSIPAGGELGAAETALSQRLESLIADYAAHLDELEFRKALQDLRAIWASGNEYLAAAAPWTAIKTDPERAAAIVRFALNLVRLFAVIAAPIVPFTSQRVLDTFALEASEREWPTGTIDTEVQRLPAGRPFADPGVLFAKITPEQTEEWRARFGSGEEATLVV
jgi:methionyl-tRNA synthetase